MDNVRISYKETGREDDTLTKPTKDPEAEPEVESTIAVTFSGNFALITKFDGVTTTIDAISLDRIGTITY